MVEDLLPAEIRIEIAERVRSGFETKESLLTAFCEEMYEPGELDEADVSVVIDHEIARLKAEQESWPDVTDCDRLDGAFRALNNRGVVALQNAGYTQSDGFEDCVAVIHDSPERESILGYCFYHGQDLERAVRGEGLYLAFGPNDEVGDSEKSAAVGRCIMAELIKAGFMVEWDGTSKARILIRQLDWKRRIK